MAFLWTADLWRGDIKPVGHSALGSARLTSEYRAQQPRLQGALCTYLDSDQSIEDVLWQVLVGRWPLTAIGVQLDMLGRIVLQDRGELSGEEYRMMLLGRIFVNRSNGRVEEMYELLSILGIIEDVILSEYHPAEIVVDVVQAEHGKVITDLAHDWKPGGVRLLWVWNTHAKKDCFAMADGLGADGVSIPSGFGDLTGATQTSGGYFSGARS